MVPVHADHAGTAETGIVLESPFQLILRILLVPHMREPGLLSHVSPLGWEHNTLTRVFD